MEPHAYPVDTVQDVRIPMPDGVHLAATLHRPAAEGRWPAIITLIPYHKDGRGGRGSTEAVHHHFARRGYAALTVDLRGLGGSEGLNPYPFDPQERRDGYAVVEWAAAQPWCTGDVGMWGTSYGGITALSVASTRPPHLRAIVPVHACADIYEDFLRPGGCRGGSWSDGDWGTRMVAYNLTPPLYQDPGGRWARLWLERLEHARPWMLSWHEHPSYDGFWRARAIPYDQIEVPVFAVCGWRDLYPDATVTYYQGIRAPKRLLMGPWKHVLPDLSPVEPIGFLHEMDRWWDEWLKGTHTGLADEPPVTVYVQGTGRWRQASDWPPPGTIPSTLYCTPARTLQTRPPAADAEPLVWRHDPTAGLASISWDPWAAHVTRQADHSPDDHRSLTYDTDPLERPLVVIGTPRVALHLAAPVTAPHVVVKLCDVAPDGSSALVTTGWASGGRAQGAAPTDIALRPTAYAFAAGHRLRLCVSGADFPRLWPDPGAHDLGVSSSSTHPSRVELPVASGDAGAVRVFEPPAAGSPRSGGDRRCGGVDDPPNAAVRRGRAGGSQGGDISARRADATPGQPSVPRRGGAGPPPRRLHHGVDGGPRRTPGGLGEDRGRVDRNHRRGAHRRGRHDRGSAGVRPAVGPPGGRLVAKTRRAARVHERRQTPHAAFDASEAGRRAAEGCRRNRRSGRVVLRDPHREGTACASRLRAGAARSRRS